jgi:transposase-like protein
MVSQLKGRIRTRALIHEKREGKVNNVQYLDCSKLAKKMHRGSYEKSLDQVLCPSLAECREPVPLLLQRNKASGKLSFAARVSIVHLVLVEKEY